MAELVAAHAALDEPMDTALWIRRDQREAWLVEVIPSMTSDPHPERHVAFSAGRGFRHPLNLIVGNLDDIRKAIQRDALLAKDIADGVVLYGPEPGESLKQFASRSLHGHSQAG